MESTRTVERPPAAGGDRTPQVHHGDSTTRWYGRLAAAFALGLAVGIVGTVLWGRASDFLHRDQDPMAYVSELITELTGRADPQVTSARLADHTGADWHLRYFMDNEKFYDVEPLTKNLAALRNKVVIPDVSMNHVAAVYTNVLNEKSVAANGSLFMMKLDMFSQVDDYLSMHPRAFVDERTNDDADVYWVGDWMVYYSSAGAATDQTNGLREFLKDWSWCAGELGTCTPGPDVANFTDWAPRHAV